MKRLVIFAIVLSAMALLSGCAITGQAYQPTYKNVSTLARIKRYRHQIALPAFQEAPGVRNSIMCRLEAPVKAGGNQTFAQYIHDAMISELKDAGLYASKSSRMLHGKLLYINFSSPPFGHGHWTVKMMFRYGNRKPFYVGTTYRFESHYGAGEGCASVGSALLPAVQKLLRKVYSRKEFQRVFK